MRDYGWQHDEVTALGYLLTNDEELEELCFEDPGVENILDELWYEQEVRDDVDTYLRMVAEEAGMLGGDEEW